MAYKFNPFTGKLDDAGAPATPPARIVVSATQVAHGFTAGQPVQTAAGVWAAAQANAEATTAKGVVTAVNGNDFEVTISGQATVTAHGRTVGEWYWLSQTTAGAITATKPAGGIQQPVLFVQDANTLLIDVSMVYRASPTSLVSNDSNTTFSVVDGLASITVDGILAASFTNVGGLPKATLPGIMDPVAYQGTVQSLAQRDALVATNGTAKAGYWVYVVDVAAEITGRYEWWDGTKWTPVNATGAVQRLTATTVGLRPGAYQFAHTAPIDITLADERGGTWQFYDPSRIAGTHPVTFLDTGGKRFSSPAGTLTAEPLVANVEGKPFTVLHPQFGTDYFVSLEQLPVTPNAFEPNGPWNAATNTPDLNAPGNRVSGTRYYQYFIPAGGSGTQDLGGGPELFEAGGEIKWYSPTTYLYLPPGSGVASPTVAGRVELATLAEVQAGTGTPTTAGSPLVATVADLAATYARSGIAHPYANAAARTAGTGRAITADDIALARVFLQVDDGSLWVATGTPAAVVWSQVGGAAVAPRLHLTNTAVAPAVAGAPTLTEITAAVGAAVDVLAYYTGTNTAADAPTHVYYVDSAGAVTLLQEPTSTNWIVAVNNQQTVDDGSYVVSANQTVLMPAAPAAGASVRFAPASDWKTLGTTFTAAGATTVAAGQALPTSNDVLEFVYDAVANNWKAFLGGAAEPLVALPVDGSAAPAIITLPPSAGSGEIKFYTLRDKTNACLLNVQPGEHLNGALNGTNLLSANAVGTQFIVIDRAIGYWDVATLEIERPLLDRISAQRAGPQNSQVALGDHIVYDVIGYTEGVGNVTLDIAPGYSNATNIRSIGRFTLKAGFTYSMEAYAGFEFSTAGAAGAIVWRNADTGAPIGPTAQANNFSQGANIANAAIVHTYFKPTVDTRVEVMLINSANVTAIDKSWASIEQMPTR